MAFIETEMNRHGTEPSGLPSVCLQGQHCNVCYLPLPLKMWQISSRAMPAFSPDRSETLLLLLLFIAVIRGHGQDQRLLRNTLYTHARVVY